MTKLALLQLISDLGLTGIQASIDHSKMDEHMLALML